MFKISKLRVYALTAEYVNSDGTSLISGTQRWLYDLRVYGKQKYGSYSSQIITSKMGEHVLSDVGAIIEFKEGNMLKVVGMDDNLSVISGVYGLTREPLDVDRTLLYGNGLSLDSVNNILSVNKEEL